jgi:hypothetical protein
LNFWDGQPLHIQRPTEILAALITIALCSVITAKADSVMFTIGNNPQCDEENVLLNNGTSGAAVFGLTNQTQLQVRFSSTTDLLVSPLRVLDWCDTKATMKRASEMIQVTKATAKRRFRDRSLVA